MNAFHFNPYSAFNRWMSWREQQFPGGAILAGNFITTCNNYFIFCLFKINSFKIQDEMGLGKTVMCIALILIGKQNYQENEQNRFTPQNL
jgi:SNF2 family DNA or RNA helicase